MDMFSVVWYRTKYDNKYNCVSDEKHLFMCDRRSAFMLWTALIREWPHVEVRNLNGDLQDMSKGLLDMSIINF